MKKLSLPLMFAALTVIAAPALAVEKLLSGDFEVAAVVPDWTLQEFYTDSSTEVDTAVVNNFSPDTLPQVLWVRAFVGGGPRRPEEGNFENDALPAGDVDGNDFLQWQRGNSPMPLTPADLTTWKNNFATIGGQKTNAVLTQTVTPASITPGESFTFKGSSRWESNYSGGVTTLDEGGPLGAVDSPTKTTLEMEFLNAQGAVVNTTPFVLDLSTEQVNINSWLPHTLTGTAPAGAVSVRVRAAARDMVWNGATATPFGGNQSAFFDSFSLTKTATPETELLLNNLLDTPIPTGLEPWTVTTNDPQNPANAEVIRTAGFANHTAGGTLGVWLSAFFGEIQLAGGGPVDGRISQEVIAQPGGLYTFTGWSRWEANYSGGLDTLISGPDAGLTSPTQTLMELAFLDANGDPIEQSTVERDLKAERRAAGGGNANDGIWRMHTLSGTAPGNAAKVRVSGIMIDGVSAVSSGAQSAFFDDFSLQGPAIVAAAGVVPEPATAAGMAMMAVALGHWTARRRPRG